MEQMISSRLLLLAVLIESILSCIPTLDPEVMLFTTPSSTLLTTDTVTTVTVTSTDDPLTTITATETATSETITMPISTTTVEPTTTMDLCPLCPNIYLNMCQGGGTCLTAMDANAVVTRDTVNNICRLTFTCPPPLFTYIQPFPGTAVQQATGVMEVTCADPPSMGWIEPSSMIQIGGVICNSFLA